MSYLWNFPPPPCAVLLVLVWDTVIIVAGLLAYVPNHLLRKSSSKTQHNEDSIGKHRGQMEKPTIMAVDLGTYDHLVQGFFGLFLRRQHWTIQQQHIVIHAKTADKPHHRPGLSRRTHLHFLTSQLRLKHGTLASPLRLKIGRPRLTGIAGKTWRANAADPQPGARKNITAVHSRGKAPRDVCPKGGWGTARSTWWNDVKWITCDTRRWGHEVNLSH